MSETMVASVNTMGHFEEPTMALRFHAGRLQQQWRSWTRANPMDQSWQAFEWRDVPGQG